MSGARQDTANKAIIDFVKGLKENSDGSVFNSSVEQIMSKLDADDKAFIVNILANQTPSGCDHYFRIDRDINIT